MACTHPERQSKSGVSRVILREGSHISRQGPGELLVVGNPKSVRVTGGGKEIVNAMMKHGRTSSHQKELAEAAEKTIGKYRGAGRVVGAFRVAGRILLVVAIAQEVYSFVYARDKVREVTRIAGGWLGGLAAAGTFSAFFAPADTAGPYAWIAHGLGAMIAFGVGYWLGAETSVTIYELTIEE